MKKISVILPCYNVSNYLRRCVMSIVNQSIGIENIEIILVNDASTDDTWDVIQSLEKEYPENIIAVSYDDNGRIGKARNVGLQYSNCDYVTFVDSDDWLEPLYLEHMYDALISHDCDLVTCCFKRDSSADLSYFDNIYSSKESRLMTVDTEDKRKLFLYLKPVRNYGWAKLFKKSFIYENDLLFPENILYEDNYWGPLLFLSINKVYILEEYLYHYFVNSDSTILRKNADYHIDLLTAHVMLWNEYLNRGVLDTYYNELTLEFAFSCYLGFLKILALRYETPNYSHYRLMKSIVDARIGTIEDNPYLKEGEIKDIHLALLQTMSVTLNKNEFNDLLKSIEASGI